VQRLARTRDVTTSAAIWDAKGGVHLVSDYLSTANLSGWTLTSATSISDDGKVVVGNGLRTASIKVGSRTFLELGSDATLATALAAFAGQPSAHIRAADALPRVRSLGRPQLRSPF
jgi:hypothetical protein